MWKRNYTVVETKMLARNLSCVYEFPYGFLCSWEAVHRRKEGPNHRLRRHRGWGKTSVGVWPVLRSLAGPYRPTLFRRGLG